MENRISEKENETKKMSITSHLEDLRGLVMRCVITLLVACICVGAFFPAFAKIMSHPLNTALSENTGLIQGLVTTTPMGIFSVLVQICLLGGFAIALPIMIYFGAKFIAPGLSHNEKKVLLPSCIAILSLFLVGAAFSYFFILPASLKVAIQLNHLFGFELIWSAPMYYGLVVWMTLGIGLSFEFPLALILLIYLGLLSTEKLRNIRRYMIVIVLIAAAAITPSGDPFSLAILAVPLYALYELAIIIGSKIEKKQEREQTAANGKDEIEWPY